MKFCQECGHEISQQATFCTNCGTKVHPPQSTNTQEEQKPTTEQAPVQQQIVPPTEPIQSDTQTGPVVEEAPLQQAKKPMSKGKKIILSIIALLVVALIGTHLFLSNHFDPMKKIEAMDEAYTQKDQEAFYDLFDIPKETNATAESFFHAVEEMDWSMLRTDLTYQAELTKEGLPTNPIAYAGTNFIRLENKSILFGLYHDVSFSLIPLKASVEIPFKGMKVTIADQTVTSKEDHEVIEMGSFLPGTYDWSFELEQNEMKMNNKGTVELYADEGNETIISPDWGFERVSIYSEVDDAIVYVNDKSTKQKITGYGELYPVILNDKTRIQLVAKDDKGKEVKSEKVALDNTNLDLTFKHIENEKAASSKRDELEQAFYNFRQDYEDAIFTLNFDYISGYFKPNSTIQKDYRKFVEDHATIAGYNYDFRTNDVTDFKELKNGKYEIRSFETFYYSSNEEGRIYYERTKKYVFTEDNGKYYVESIDNLTTDKKKQ